MTKQPHIHLSFGKYAGRTVSEVAGDDPQYLRWLLENVDIRDEELREAVEAYVDNDPEDPPEWRYDHDY